MVVDKYLKALALANRRIIIPDLGAFLSKEGDGDGKNLIFSSFLKYNDGFLESYIAEKEKISAPDSAALVKKFVDEVGKTIRAGRHYEVENFGYFYMDERGGVAFMSKGAEAEAATTTTTATTTVPVAETVTPTPVQQVVVTPAPVVVEPVVVQQTPPATPPPSRPTVSSTTVKREPEPKKNNNGLLITVIILLLIILLLIVSYFLIPEVKERVNAMLGRTTTTAVDTTTNTNNQPVTTQDTTSVEQTPQTGTTEGTTQTTTPDTHTNANANTNTGTSPKVGTTTTPAVSAVDANAYYVIVGTFQEKANADKMLQKCLADGYDAELLPKMGPLYPVSIFKSTTKSEAYGKWQEAKKKYGDSWIFKSRR